VWPVFAAYGAMLAWLFLASLALVVAAGTSGVVSPRLLVASLALNSASLVAAALVGATVPSTRRSGGCGRAPAASRGEPSRSASSGSWP
jgi:hypothetical protein